MENNLYNENDDLQEFNSITDHGFDENDVINDQLSRDTQEKIEKDIIANFPLVSDKIALDRLSLEYAAEDLVYQQKVDDLKQNYNAIRKTRPDGNCFYRAFIFSYFESLFGDDVEQKRFLECCNVTRKGIEEVLGFPDFTIDEFYEYYYEIVNLILDGQITTSNQLLAALDAPAVYDNIVVYLRLLTSYYLQKESDFFANFIEGSGQIGDFCKREVEPMYKESDHIHIIALSSVLDVTVRIVYMDRGAGGKVNEHDFNPLKEEGPPKPPRVHLLYRPGHYDVLYVTDGSEPEALVPASPLRNEPVESSTSNGIGPGPSSSIPIGLSSPSRVPPLSPARPFEQQEEPDSSSLSPRARIPAVVNNIARPDTPDSNAGNASPFRDANSLEPSYQPPTPYSAHGDSDGEDPSSNQPDL